MPLGVPESRGELGVFVKRFGVWLNGPLRIGAEEPQQVSVGDFASDASG